jgi:hypothetical protein
MRLIVGLPPSLANRIALILNPGGQGTTDARDLAWNERVYELLLIFALHVHQDEQCTDKTWGSVIRCLNDPAETLAHKLKTVSSRASKSNQKPGSAEWFLADLADTYLRYAPSELDSILADARVRLDNAEDTIRDLPIVEPGDDDVPQGKGSQFVLD